MTAPVPPDDIVGLFQKFDGDAGSYRKFASPAAPEPTAEWPLLASSRTEAAPPAAAGPAPAEPASPAMPSAQLAPLFRHAAATVAPSLPMGTAAAGNDARMAPLQQLFERLAQQPPASASPPAIRHGLLRSWRRQA